MVEIKCKKCGNIQKYTGKKDPFKQTIQSVCKGCGNKTARFEGVVVETPKKQPKTTEKKQETTEEQPKTTIEFNEEITNSKGIIEESNSLTEEEIAHLWLCYKHMMRNRCSTEANREKLFQIIKRRERKANN